jgi:prepilin-type processing-associated H-X9-DG protein
LTKPGPAGTYVVLDEHGDCIDDGVFQFDPGQTQGAIYWRNMPANYHGGTYSVSFADGHSAIVKLVERGGNATARTSLLKVVPSTSYSFMNNYNSSPQFSGNHYIVGFSKDYQTLDDEMPFK